MARQEHNVSFVSFSSLGRLADRAVGAHKRSLVVKADQPPTEEGLQPLPLFEPLPSLGLDRQPVEPG